MVPFIETRQAKVADLCRQHRVRRLEVFGSGATGEGFDAHRSDLDFLVEFDRTTEMNPADQYFGLWEDLKVLFGRDVDLVTVRALRNPYFIRSVNLTREIVYAS